MTQDVTLAPLVGCDRAGYRLGYGAGYFDRTLAHLSPRIVGFALHLTTAIARPAARDESSARRAIAQPAPIGVNDQKTPVMTG